MVTYLLQKGKPGVDNAKTILFIYLYYGTSPFLLFGNHSPDKRCKYFHMSTVYLKLNGMIKVRVGLFSHYPLSAEVWELRLGSFCQQLPGRRPAPIKQSRIWCKNATLLNLAHRAEAPQWW